jgi:hypothetical protein
MARKRRAGAADAAMTAPLTECDALDCLNFYIFPAFLRVNR